MSQEDVLQILKDCGGVATTKQIREKAKSKYPDRTLHSYVYDRLKRLKKWGQVEYRNSNWYLVKKA